MQQSTQTLATPVSLIKRRSTWSKIIEQRFLFLMSVPFVIWLIIFHYIPIWGWTMAFQKYKPGKSFSEQTWVGFDNFVTLFHEPHFYLVLRNTLAMSFLSLIVGYTVPILFAILLNEVRVMSIKRTMQTISYLPHFVSWVIVAGLVSKMLSTDGGIVNQLLLTLHVIDKPIQFMAQGKWFWGIVTVSDMWKETGWNSIIYLAAISGIDPELYEAATMDGAGRFRRIWHITLPGIRPTIMIMMILSIGWLMSIGFEKQFLLGNSIVKDYSEVLDLYVLNYGINLGRFSYGTAVGMFNSLVSIVLLFSANRIFKRWTNESVI
ncbi:sugar ABC transporter permease [Paenibacillus alginolyticus]|uniref:Sugar ABC transporter permease n=1 Tax=Paenibacillus alginolyticus TaxID=59839 RepID=A0ABT4GL02_9BACL|nr:MULTISPECIES: sugar ABC transporter permease [Paenibacillus]MCY9667276.1 sugar ABC transporter permease [Paenibacillus alginolyticus]MCY9696877.1 sugar ABC transporter permease [Paenibacillus alginolyticus]MEC0142033.1 sugar ABC transporter permease [Paenibacillus alginolyticus]NRF95306.1 sugar ABC transporter permease [Paenibacillus frigoriresistens]